MTQNQKPAVELRTQWELRALLDKYLKNGWSIESTDPVVVISRGRIAKHVDYGCLKDGRPSESGTDQQPDRADPNGRTQGSPSGTQAPIL